MNHFRMALYSSLLLLRQEILPETHIDKLIILSSTKNFMVKKKADSLQVSVLS